MVHNELTVLIKYGTATQLQLQKAWESIYNEYAILIESSTYTTILKFTKDISLLQAKKDIIRGSIMALLYGYSEQSINILAKYGYVVKSKYEDTEQFNAELEKILIRIKSIDVEISLNEKLLADFYKNNQGQQVTEKYFNKLVSRLMAYYKMMIDKNTITVEQFAGLLNDYNEIMKDNGKG